MIGRLVVCLLLVASTAWAQPQPPPTEARTVDGSTSCQPSYLFQFPNGSLTCGTVAGKPSAIVNLGATPATLPWQNVTAGTSTGQNLTVGAGGVFRPAGGGIVEANRATPAGVTGNCMEWGAGGAFGDAGAPCGSGGGSNNFSDLQPDAPNTNAGDFSFQGTANVDIQSQARFPSSTSAPAVDREIKIDSNCDNSSITTACLAMRELGTVYYIPTPDTSPLSTGKS